MMFKCRMMKPVALTVAMTCMGWADDSPIVEEIRAERQKLMEQQQMLELQLRETEEQKARLDRLEKRVYASPANRTDDGEAPVEKKKKENSLEAFINMNNDIPPERIKIGPYESRDSANVLTAADLVNDDFKGSWPLFGTDYRLKFGGYFKFDMLYDFDGTGNHTQFLISQIPVDGSADAEKSGYFNMFVNETRFNFDLRPSHSDVPQQFFLEFGFFGGDSDYPRLRHAYMTYGNLLVGQTWATYVELASFVYMIDFAFGDALFGNRTPQVRWQEQISPEWSWAVAVEKMQTTGIYNPYNLNGEASEQLPLVTARVTQSTESGLHMLAVLAQQLYWDGGATGKDASATGWALIYAGRKNIFDNSYVTWNLAYGDGTSDIIMALTGSEANAILTADGTLETRRGYSVALGLGHKWNHTLVSNLSYAVTDLEENERAPQAVQSGYVGHVNLIWSPAEKLSTGVEYMWGHRENSDGARGDATRIQTMVKYDF